MTKLFSIYQDVEGDLNTGADINPPVIPDIPEAAVLRAIYSCDGILSAVRGFLLARNKIRLSRDRLESMIETNPVLRAAMASCKAQKRDLCEEVVLMHAKAGSDKAARWLLERYDPQNFGSGVLASEPAANRFASEVPVMQSLSSEDWVSRFSGLRQRQDIH